MLNVMIRLEFCTIYNFEWYERRTFGYVRWRYHTKIIRREMENICESKLI